MYIYIYIYLIILKIYLSFIFRQDILDLRIKLKAIQNVLLTTYKIKNSLKTHFKTSYNFH